MNIRLRPAQYKLLKYAITRAIEHDESLLDCYAENPKDKWITSQRKPILRSISRLKALFISIKKQEQ